MLQDVMKTSEFLVVKTKDKTVSFLMSKDIQQAPECVIIEERNAFKIVERTTGRLFGYFSKDEVLAMYNEYQTRTEHIEVEEDTKPKATE